MVSLRYLLVLLTILPISTIMLSSCIFRCSVSNIGSHSLRKLFSSVSNADASSLEISNESLENINEIEHHSYNYS